MPGAYVPPHMRNRAPVVPLPQPKSHLQPSPAISAPRDKPRPVSTDRLNSRTPWSRATPASSSTTATPPPRDTWPTYDNQPLSQGSRNSTPSVSRSSSGPGRTRGAVGSPSLYVFGDSFVGPMKLLSDECSRATTYKGASAKGLNNPNSAKQVSKLLLPALNDLMAPPPYRYMPSIGRWALLVFGNVDLQINYLWQLQHKPLSHLSFPDTNSSISTSADGDTDTEEDEATPAAHRVVLARATETSLTGPALGPELFVQAVVKAYTSWLEREIVNGPIGERIKESARRREAIEKGEIMGKPPPPGKILVAGALPPLVDDETLHRIPEKYVERLEDDHEKAQKLLESEGESWRGFQMRREKSTESAEEGIATINMTDRPPTPLSGSSSSSRGTETTLESFSSASSLDPEPTKESINKTSIQSLLEHDPPLCTLPIRVQMTNTFNLLVRSFCQKHPTVLSFIDIGPRMLSIDSTSGWDTGKMGEVDRGTWACPVDPTNVHPLWEPTLPLWLEVMKEAGLPVEGYTMEEGSEETFRAYELDKRRRTKEREGERVKIRDE